ncbi:homing endonuclease [Caudoviricetes sp.]|nr:homing endonuclease [Caudoviricetes sp.]
MQLSSDCWYWAGIHGASGYGSVWNGQKLLRAHRAVYEALVGEIPEGLVLDHLCKNKICVNPGHLEPVTQTENMRRFDYSTRKLPEKTHCPHGHVLDRTRRHYGKSHKECSTCKLLQNKRRSAVRSEKRAQARRDSGLPAHGNSLHVKAQSLSKGDSYEKILPTTIFLGGT